MKSIPLSVKISFIVATAVAICGVSSAAVLLDETWADADRTNTNLPNESAFWVGHPDQVTMGTGSLAYSMGGSSEKMWTYFAPNGSPVTIGVGQQLVTTIKLVPNGLYDTASENFRFGLFTDPTDSQILDDRGDDGGGTGDLGQDDPWTDSTGYAVRFPLSNGTTTADNPQIGKRTDMTNNSLLGSSGAYTWDSGGDNIINVDSTLQTITFVLDRTAADQMLVTFTIADAGGVLSSHSMLDSSGIYTDFDQLFFRLSKAEGSADVVDFRQLKVELIPEPATMLLLGLGGLIAIRRKR